MYYIHNNFSFYDNTRYPSWSLTFSSQNRVMNILKNSEYFQGIMDSFMYHTHMVVEHITFTFVLYLVPKVRNYTE